MNTVAPQAILASLILLLYAVIYLLFEYGHAWPYNDDVFHVLRAVMITGMVGSVLLIAFKYPFFGVIFLGFSILAILIVSHSMINYAIVALQFLVLLLIYVVARRVTP